MKYQTNTTGSLFTKLAINAAIIASLSACNGGGSGDGNQVSPNPAPNTTVEEVLTDLGIDTTVTPRIDTDGDDLPETYAPLGSRQSVNKYSEVMLFGVAADDADIAQSGNRMPVANLYPANNNSYNWELLHDEPLANAPWLDGTQTRAAVAGDFDNDGQDEVAIVYQQTNSDVKLVIMQDAAEGYTLSTESVVDTNAWSNLFLTTGDYDGNGTQDIVVGMTAEAGGAKLVMLANDNGVLALNGLSVDIAKEQYSNTQLAFASGNLDFDNAIELAVVVNEGSLTSSNLNVTSASHRYFVYDDALAGFALTKTGKLVADNGSGSTQALVANVAVGDVDGDSIDEIVFAGLDRVGGDSQSNNTEYNYVIQVFDDAKRGYAQLVDGFIPSNVSSLRQENGVNHAFSYAQVITADIDGDGAKEFAVNQFVFNSMRTSPFGLTAFDDDGDASNGVAEIQLDNWMKEDGTSNSFNFNWTTSAIAAADVTMDKRENIVIYSQRGGSSIQNTHELQVWGLDQINGWSKMAAYTAKKQNYNTPAKPQILLPDLELDDGSAALVYSEGSHQLVFTEPVIIAALAAAPCATNLGQDLGESCRTAFGGAISDTTSRTNGWNVSAGVSVGYGASIPLTGNGIEVLADIQTTVRHWDTNAYTLRKSVLRETGANEDAVILTVLPLDVYTYTILSHRDPSLVGQTVQVRMPRELITTMVTREYYNANVLEGEPLIDESIFRHTAGDPSSYPSSVEKNSLLSSHDGLQSDEFVTGVGLGQTIATISEFSTSTTGSAYEFQATLDLKVTGLGIITGLSVGAGTNTALEITHGTETVYQGSVGNISSDAFDQGQAYNWGLFSYIHEDNDTGKAFEVLNYWVN